MTALWILGGIAAFIALLLIVRLGVRVSFDPGGSPSLTLSIGAAGLYFRILPKKPHLKHKKRRFLPWLGARIRDLFSLIGRGLRALAHLIFHKRSDDEEEEEEEEKPEEKEEEEHAKRPLSEILDLVSALLAGVRRMLRPLFKAIHLNIDVSLAVASGDASQTAITYGRICAALSQLVPQLYNIFSVHDCRVHVDADFASDKLRVRGSLAVTTSLGGLLGAGFAFLFAFLRVYLSKKQGRKSRQKG